jgi:hypothetical protein
MEVTPIVRMPWNRRSSPCPSVLAGRSLERAKEDVAAQRHKLHEEINNIDRLKAIRERNGLAIALYHALSSKNGGA